ncbi:hypothetical protein WKI71_36635 [Streptomyces sp. MS1.AVA.1]|uniref:Uncharacterized protein n=1 Tax=Streptomyces machairae TaxID=3134109 RepID=A0ABU8USK7_9ACTN
MDGTEYLRGVTAPMEQDGMPDLSMTPMDQAMAQLAELIESLKRAGLSEQAAVRFAAIYFNEQSGNVDDPDTD